MTDENREFSKVMQTRDVVEGLHNCLKKSVLLRVGKYIRINVAEINTYSHVFSHSIFFIQRCQTLNNCI